MSRPGASAGGPARSARDIAREVLERVERDGAFANRALSSALDRLPGLPPAERGLATELTYGVLRRRSRLDRALEALSDRGLGGLDLRARVALRVGAYQILFLDRVPAYAAVTETVEACKRLRGARFGGLANALLRKLATRGEPPLPDPARDPLGHLVDASGVPEWLARLMMNELGAEQAVALGQSMGAAASLAIRANTLRADRDAVQAAIAAERPGAELAASPVAPDALVVRRVDAPFETAAWRDGLFAVEDIGAQVVVELCGAAPGERILDACAGLGGKSAHLAALAGGRARIDAVDVSPAKLRQAAELFTRLEVAGVETRVADLTRPLAGAPAAGYDRVLLDAPCSGLGVLRRHPEALLRRRPEDLPGLAEVQSRMLDVAAAVVAPGGVLVYSVCTFDRVEGPDRVARFVTAHPEFRVERPAPDGARLPWDQLTDAEGYVRTWPHRHEADAFFAVRLRRGPAR